MRILLALALVLLAAPSFACDEFCRDRGADYNPNYEYRRDIQAERLDALLRVNERAGPQPTIERRREPVLRDDFNRRYNGFDREVGNPYAPRRR